MDKIYLNIVILFLIIQVSFSINQLCADGPIERYHISYSELSDEILTNTIGVVTLNSGIKEGTRLLSYRMKDQKFILADTLDVLNETVPISNFGYTKELAPNNNLIENYRFPILDTLGNYLNIVYNSKTNSKTWIDIDEVNTNFFTTMLFFSNMMKHRTSYFLDLFFNPDNKVKIYKDPSTESEFKVLTKENKLTNYYPIEVIQQNKDFIEIAAHEIDYSTNTETTTAIGWIKIKDEENKLYFWIKDIDFY